MSAQEPSSTEKKSHTHFKGSCFCKAISFTLSSLPSRSYLCHCLDCRRFSGSSFAHNAAFPRSALTVSFGEPGEVAFASPDSQKYEKRSYDATVDSSAESQAAQDTGNKGTMSTFGAVETGTSKFCGNCGTRLFLFCGTANVEMSDQVIVPVGAIDGSHEDERLKPGAEGWCRRRESWMPTMVGTSVHEFW